MAAFRALTRRTFGALWRTSLEPHFRCQSADLHLAQHRSLSMPLIGRLWADIDTCCRQGIRVVLRLVEAVHVAVNGFERMEGDLGGKARWPVWVPGRRALVTRIATLEEEVVGVHPVDAELCEAVPEEPVLLPAFRGLALLALRVPMIEGLERPHGEDLDWPMHSQAAVVQPESLFRLFFGERSVLGQEQCLQPHRNEHRVWIELHDPIAFIGMLVVEDLPPEPQEDSSVQHRVEFSAEHPGQTPVDEARLDDRVLPLRGKLDGPVAVDCELVAREKAQLAVRVLGPQEVRLVAAGHHHCSAEQGRSRAVEGAHRVQELGGVVLGLRLVHAGVEVLAATFV
mmetsp:Transcript_64660/g.187380  ORF Transcript_64660/g.187380 Transcript_64660/m.187380 type:complete len:341 (+) Transcript_64660:182-1204(+)